MRQVILTATRPALTILLVACALSCAPRAVKTAFSPVLVDAQGRPSLGYLEHRGEMYDLRDWSSSVYDEGESDKAFANVFLGPTIADDGSGSYWVTPISRLVVEQVRIFGFGLEDPEEDQCVEITDLDGPILPGLRLVIPE
jgi:hypothetical protein